MSFRVDIKPTELSDIPVKEVQISHEIRAQTNFAKPPGGPRRHLVCRGETALDGAAPKAGSPAMRQWFQVEEPEAAPALVAGRPVRNIDPQEGFSSTKRGTATGWRVAAKLSPSMPR